MINYTTSNNIATLSRQLLQYINTCDVIMCVGTSRVLSDSIGPKVGDKLQNSLAKLYIYGTTDSNITALNIEESYQNIRNLHPSSTILMVDSAVGDDSQLGCAQLICNGIVPGQATQKDFASMGDISIIGIVSDRKMRDFYCADSAKTALVDSLVELISSTLINVFCCENAHN